MQSYSNNLCSLCAYNTAQNPCFIVPIRPLTGILINFFYLIIFFLHTIIIAQMSSTGPVLASQDPITAGTSVHQNTHRRIHPWAYPYHITYVDSAFVGQCPTWWSPCRTEVVPFVQCRKVWLTLTTWLPCSNAAKTRKPLKLAVLPQTTGSISAASRPKFTILWRQSNEGN